MSNFDLDKEKAATIARLEAIERVGLDIKALNTKLADLNVVELIENYVKTEVTKIEKYAAKHSIPLTLDANALVAVVKVPGNDVKVDGNVGIVLPFVPGNGERIYDETFDQQWEYNKYQKRFVPEEEWESSWNDSGC